MLNPIGRRSTYNDKHYKTLTGRKQKQKNPLENLGQSGKIEDLGSRGVWRIIFIADSIKRITQKLRRIILLHLGLITFRIHFRKTRKPRMCMFFSLADVTMTPKTKICVILDTPSYHKRDKKSDNNLSKYIITE